MSQPVILTVSCWLSLACQEVNPLCLQSHSIPALTIYSDLGAHQYPWNGEYIIKNSGLDEAQADIKVARTHINDLKYADDTTLMAEREELKSLLMKGKDKSGKAGLKLNIQKLRV